MDSLPEHSTDTTRTAHQLAQLAEVLDGVIGGVTREAVIELRQTRDLVAEAIGTLDRSFGAIGGGSSEQQRLVSILTEQLRANDQANTAEDILKQLEDTQLQVHEQVGVAVRSLQFEDLVRQIVERLDQRMTLLSELSAGLAEQAIKLADEGMDTKDSLERLRAQVEASRQHLAGSSHRPVVQESMDAGDVELF